MVKCAYKGCNTVRRFGSCSFFKIPLDHRKQIWMKHAQCENQTQFAYFCEQHFFSKDIKCESLRKRLDVNALPISLASICSCSESTIDNSCLSIMNSCRSGQQLTSTATTSGKMIQPIETSGSSNQSELSSSTSENCYKGDYSLSDLPSSSHISPSQFPSPVRQSNRMNKSKTFQPRDISQPYILETPKPQKVDREYQLRKLLERQLEGSPIDVQTFVFAQTFHKPNSHWGNDEKDVCLKLFYKCPSAYSHLLCSGFKLPAISTIYRWHSTLRLPAGFSEQMLSLLTNKAQLMTALERKCVLFFYEKAIKAELEYNIKDDLIYGFTDFGELGRTTVIATKVIVFTLKGLNNNWKQTISYYVGCPKGKDIAEMLKINLSKILDCGLNVVATSCEQGTDNELAYKLLGVSADKPYYDVGSQRIFMLYDYSHLFKSVWNILLKHNIIITGDIIDWKVLVKLYEQDSKRIFQVFFKLTKSHVCPNSFEKLSVKLATQVFSANVAAGILYALNANCYKTDEEKIVAYSTATFIQKMNDLFDNLNCDSLSSRNPQPLSESTDTLQSIKSARLWIASWDYSGTLQKPPCFSGLVQTLLGIELMWTHLKNTEQTFLPLSHLNTDVAENLFSMARTNRVSYEKNPSAYRFIRNLKQIILQPLKSSNNAGYKDAGGDPLLDDTDRKQLDMESAVDEEYAIEAPVEDHILKSDITNKIEYPNEETNGNTIETVISKGCSEKLQEAALTFYMVFAAFKLRKKINCEACTKFMIDGTNKYREQAVLIRLKAYETTNTVSEFGQLTVPTTEFEDTVKRTQEIFETFFPEDRKQENLVETLLWQIINQFKVTKNMTCTTYGHSEEIIKFILIGLTKFCIKKNSKDLRMSEYMLKHDVNVM